MPEVNKIKFSKFLYQTKMIAESEYKELEKIPDDKLQPYFENNNLISREAYNLYLKAYHKTDFIDLSIVKIEEKLLSILPEKYARQYYVIAFEMTDQYIKIATRNPLNHDIANQLIKVTHHPVKLYLADHEAIIACINKLYKSENFFDQFVSKKNQEISKDVSSYKTKSLMINKREDEDDIVDHILISACRSGVSDIHIESSNNIIRIRNRIEGSLDEKMINSSHISNIIFRRLRILGNLDILKDKVPQDGSFNYIVDENQYNMRLSLLPTNNGTSAVIRIASAVSTDSLSLDKIVQDIDLKNNIKDFLIKKEGLMLVTGPTGSGKTTLLYCSLAEVNKPDIKVISVEDPVEASIDRVCQVQVNKEIGLDFIKILRSVLRQDPDVIMVGEIRDEETAQISFQAAITGHKVFSTLHAKSVKNTIERLLDLNIDNYIMSAALNVIVAQRLVRILCQHCKVNSDIDPKYINKLKQLIPNIDLKQIKFKKSTGCFHCGMRGYKGRKAVAESLVINDQMRKFIVTRDFTQFQNLVEEALSGKKIFDKAYQLAINHDIDIYELLALAD